MRCQQLTPRCHLAVAEGEALWTPRLSPVEILRENHFVAPDGCPAGDPKVSGDHDKRVVVTTQRDRGGHDAGKTDRRAGSGRGTVLAAIITGVATIVGAAITLAATRTTDQADSKPSSPAAVAPTSTSPPSPSGARLDCPGPSAALTPGDTVDITAPRDGDPVDYSVTDATGTATLAPGHYLWFFTWAATVQLMYIMGGPSSVDHGLWTLPDLQFGDGSGDDAGKPFCLTVMVVDATENDFLEHVVATRRDTGWALTKAEIPQTALAKTIVVVLRRATR